MNKKPLSFRSSLHFCSAPKSLQIFSRVPFPASKFTPIKLIKKKGLLQYSSSSRNKKGLLQYSSSSRKKRQSTNTIQFLDCKNQEHRNIASLSLQLRSYKNKTILQKGC